MIYMPPLLRKYFWDSLKDLTISLRFWWRAYIALEEQLYRIYELWCCLNAIDVVDELFESLLSRCQIGLETLITGNDFYFWLSSTVALQMSQDKL